MNLLILLAGLNLDCCGIGVIPETSFPMLLLLLLLIWPILDIYVDLPDTHLSQTFTGWESSYYYNNTSWCIHWMLRREGVRWPSRTPPDSSSHLGSYHTWEQQLAPSFVRYLPAERTPQWFSYSIVYVDEET